MGLAADFVQIAGSGSVQLFGVVAEVSGSLESLLAVLSLAM